jgi:hypothetical protein
MVWPPRDPDESKYEDPDHDLALPASPWTYEDEAFNPMLQANNSTTRQRRNARRRQDGEVAAVPPYHPDFDETQGVQPTRYDDSSSDDEVYRGVRVRRGSEGYEVRPVDRNEMLNRYVQEMATEQGRYKRYVPEPPSGSDSEEEHVPLAQLHPYAAPAS